MQHLQASGGGGIGVPYTMTLASAEYAGVVESWTWEAAWVDGKARGVVSQVSAHLQSRLLSCSYTLPVLIVLCSVQSERPYPCTAGCLGDVSRKGSAWQDDACEASMYITSEKGSKRTCEVGLKHLRRGSNVVSVLQTLCDPVLMPGCMRAALGSADEEQREHHRCGRRFGGQVCQPAPAGRLHQRHRLQPPDMSGPPGQRPACPEGPFSCVSDSCAVCMEPAQT